LGSINIKLNKKQKIIQRKYLKAYRRVDEYFIIILRLIVKPEAKLSMQNQVINSLFTFENEEDEDD